MQPEKLHRNLLNVIKATVPQDANIANTLANILCIGKEAIYRRIRGDVPFSFAEIALIAECLNISLDTIVGTSIWNSAIFHIDKNNYLNPHNNHYESFYKCIDYFKLVTAEADSELGYSGNSIPCSFLYKYPNIKKFKTLKWMLQHCPNDSVKNFQHLQLPDKLIELQNIHAQLYTRFKKSFYTFDSQIFTFLINDIKYFYSVNLLNDNDINTLKTELKLFLIELEEMSAKGQFDNGNKLKIHVSSLNFETNYTYIESPSFYLSMVHIFIFNALSSYDREMFNDIKNMMKSHQRFATLISETGEAQRINFFKEQHKLADTL